MPSSAPAGGATAIPVFDLSAPPSPALSAAVLAAATTHGFLYIRSAPLFPAALTAQVFSLSRAFFAQPAAAKSPFAMTADNRGWTSAGQETLDPATQAEGDPKEAFNFGEFAAGSLPAQPVPPVFAGAAAPLAEFAARCRAACARVLEELARGLQIEEGPAWFAARHDPAAGESGTILRLLHYLPGASGQGGVRAGAHSDYGSLTLLFREAPAAAPQAAGTDVERQCAVPLPGGGACARSLACQRHGMGARRAVSGRSMPFDQLLAACSNDAQAGSRPAPPPPERPGAPEGLEILTPEGDWAAVPVVPAGTEGDEAPPVLVNIGDLLSFWTGGLLKSTVHRVAFAGDGPADHRYSMAFFCHPARHTKLVPVPSPVVREHLSSKAAEGRSEGIGAGSGAAGHGAAPISADEHLQRRLDATYGWES